MESKLVNQDEEKIVLTVELNEEDWNKALESAYERTRDKYKIEGFRKGKAPRKMIEKFYGERVFFEEAFNQSISEFYINYLKENSEIKPLNSFPEFKIDDLSEKGYKVTLTIALIPNVELGEYKGVEVKKIVYEVKDEDVEREINHMLEGKATEVECDLDKTVENGDIAVIDFDGTIDGERFDGGMAEDYPLAIGSHTFIDTFEDQLLGMKKGETKDVKVKFPKDYDAKNLADKDAVFYVTVKEIKQKKLPEFDDEFAKSLGEFEDANALRAFIRTALENQAKERSRHETENALVDIIVNKISVKIPENMIEMQLEKIMQDINYRLMYQGINLEQYANMTGTTVEKLREERRQDAEKSVKTRLVLEKILELENIDVSPEEIDNKIQELAKSSNKSFEEFKKSLPKQQLDYIINDVVVNKLFDYLASQNKFVD